MNSFCSSSVSASEYFPIFMVVHAILIGAPHYLWLNHYGGSFEFFFQLASDMKLLRDENTGEYEKRNHQTVEKLEAAFGTYNRKRIYVWYIVKLVYQCVFTVIGFVVAIFFFTDFDENFPCPRSLNETYDNPQWPLPNQQVNCVFKSLRLIEVIRVADLILLILAFVGLISSFIWCATTHSTELGSKEAAQFSFQSGLAPKYYVPKVHKEMCHFKNRKLNHCCFCCFKLVGAWIKNDFEFMVMKLFRTDGGLGHVLKEVQIDREIKHLNSIERRRLELHKREQNSKFLHSGALSEENVTKNLGWSFAKQKEKSIYGSHRQETQLLVVPHVLRGAVLGFAAHSPTNTGALCITFGSPSLGFADALGRVFTSVGCFNFNPFYRCKEKPILVDRDPVGVVSVLCTEESINRNQNKLLHDAEEIWIRRTGHETTTVKTGFILVGPITQDSYISTANLLIHFLKQAELLEPKAKLVSVRPMEIENTNVKKVFKEYTPPEDYFSRDGIPIAVDVQKSGDEPLKWAVEEKSSVNQSNSVPAQGNTANSAPAQGNTAGSAPAQGNTADSAPAQGNTADSAPAQGNMAGSAPAQGNAADSAPAQGNAADSAPAQGNTADSAPAPVNQADSAPAPVNQAGSAPVNQADSAPAQGNTADSAPAQRNTANSVPNNHLLQLKAGDVPGKFQFYLYKLKDVTVHV